MEALKIGIIRRSLLISSRERGNMDLGCKLQGGLQSVRANRGALSRVKSDNTRQTHRHTDRHTHTHTETDRHRQKPQNELSNAVRQNQ